MAFTSFTNTEIQVKQPVSQQLWQKVKDNDDYLYTQSKSPGEIVLNGSFEIDSDADGIPDLWTRYLYPGGIGAFETDIPAHGSKSYKFTHPGGAGNGGGYLESDYIETASIAGVLNSVGYIMWSTVATIRNQVIVRFYTQAKVYISENIIYDNQATNPTSPIALFNYIGIIPSTTRYIKIRFVGGEPSVDIAGTTYFDRIVLNPSLERLIPATIAEAIRDTTTWIDAGSVTIPLPITGAIDIGFSAELKSSSNNTIYQRFRIEDSYSNERETNSTSYVSFYYAIRIAPVNTSSIILIQQLKVATYGYSAYGKKSVPQTNIKYIT